MWETKGRWILLCLASEIYVMCLLEILDFDGLMVEWTWKENERARERECLLNPQGSTKWSSHSFEKALWVFTYIILLPISYWCAWNFLVYMLFGYVMKSDRYCPHTSDEHTFSSGKKIAATLTVLTKCSHYKLLLLLLYIHVCMCTAKQLNIVHLNYLITINIIAWNLERVMYRVIIGCAFSRTQRVNVVHKHSSRNIQCLSIQFLSSSYTDGLVCPCPYSRVEIVNFVYL